MLDSVGENWLFGSAEASCPSPLCCVGEGHLDRKAEDEGWALHERFLCW